jgi:EAL domain-containing protein (putative c-di-GMP-specific phosphodiesterase class I)
MKVLHHSTDHPIRRGLEKTFRNPMTYVGAFMVGGLSLYTYDYNWGFATPFLVPLLVQAITRVMAERDHHAAHMHDVAISEAHDDGVPSLLNMDEMVEVLQGAYQHNDPRTLIKITINQASEVVRLSEPDHLVAEAGLLAHLEAVIHQEFEDGHVYQLAFNAYMVVLNGAYHEVSERLHDFAAANAPRRVNIAARAYYPKMIIGITELEENFGTSLSRLEFAVCKAAVSAEKTACYVPNGAPDFAEYQSRRSGLRILRHALDNAELGLFAQPIVPLDAESAVEARKFEVLLRHYQDAATIVPPMDILTFAAFNEATQDVDLYVVDLLCRNFQVLFGAEGERVDTVTINISGPSFISPRFSEAVIKIVQKYDVPVEKLVLEVTEDVANSAKKQAVLTMKRFREAGFQLALDDIGTGSSNFRTLHEFPVNFFKIDRSYCEEVVGDPSTRAFVQLIIDIGKANAKQIIAEGIPDEETRELLRSMGADFSQSFLTGRPEELICAPKFAAPEPKLKS